MNEEKKTVSKTEEFIKSDYVELEIPDDVKDTEKKEKATKEETKSEKKDESNSDEVKTEKKSEKEDKKSEKADKKSEKDDKKSEKQDKKSEKDEKVDVKEQEPYVAPVEKKKKKWPIVTLVTVLVLLIIAYGTGFWYFSSHFYPDVAINANDVSNMDEPVAAQTIANFYKAYTLTMHTVDGSDVVIVGNDIDMQITLKESVARCFKDQKPYIWFVEIFNHQDFTIDADASWNQDKLDAIYKDMDILKSNKIVDPEDAYIGYDNGKFVIVDEIMGNRLDEEVFKNKVNENLSTIQAQFDLKEADCYKKPALYKDSDSLVKEYEALGDFANFAITIKLDDFELEPSLEALDKILEPSGSPRALSEANVKKYVSELANQYDTYGKKRKFKTSWADKYIEIEGKSFGYTMDQDKTASDIIAAYNEKRTATVDATFTQKGITLIGENDIGDTYIEANLSKQKVIAYKNGKKIGESDCVSGKYAAGNGTCLGMYRIQGKQSPSVLVGEPVTVTNTVVAFDEEGNPYETVETTTKPSYESHVTYWMPFNGGYGLHDADGWRSRYGGDIFYYSGSHGCINLPREFAKVLYENFDIGTPVLVYYEDDDDRISHK